MQIIMAVLISAAVMLFLFPFVLYPALLSALPRRPRPRRNSQAGELPSVAMVICALNEQKVIREKMENCLTLDYPREKLRIVVVSDGSTDRTASIVREYAAAGIELIERTQRRGKIANLNEVLPACREDILVLSDANVFYKPDALLQLTAPFADPSVGCVSGKVILTGTADVLDQPTEHYYSIEWLLQERSSELYSMPGADGAMYALRRELFRPCPDDTLIEDFIIPMEVVRQGKRVIFEPEAVAWEPGVTSLAEEFRRKVRIAAGAAQAMVRGNAWPKNAPARFWFVFIAHKLLRWLSPALGAIIVVLCLASLGHPISTVVLAGVGLMTALAAVRLVSGVNSPLFSAPFYFLFAQAALGWGLLKGLLGQQSVLWAKADR